MVVEVIFKERMKFPDESSRRIFVGGYSQGAMVALAAFNKYPGVYPMGGVYALNGLQALKNFSKLDN